MKIPTEQNIQGTQIQQKNQKQHVYNKDGKPVIIAWSNNNSKNIEIDYKNFIAKDIYGKEIKANEKEKLVITTSPVYIYNLDYKYYYKAISKSSNRKI